MMAGDQDDLPEIHHQDGDLPAATDATIAAVAKLGDGGCFVFANRLHRIYTAEKAEDGEIRRPSGAVRLHPVDATHFTELATRTAVHKKFDRRAGEDRVINCPRRVAESALARGHWPTLPILHGILEAPSLTPKGRPIDVLGYDKKTGFYLTNRPEKYTPPKSTLAAARGAVDRFVDLYSSFPFVSDEDRSAAIAATITVLVRRGLLAAPIIAYTAPAAGTGKSTATDILAMIAMGRQAAMLSLGSDEQEIEKRIYSVLGSGDVLIGLDNLTVPLRSSLLCQVATQPEVQFRPLGHSSIVRVPTNTTIVANGNCLSISGDLPSRTMLVRLDAKIERPDTRSFDRDILAHVLKYRGALISLALTIPKAYIEAGAPSVGLRPCRFPGWDMMVRRALVWAGQSDPLIPAESILESDPDHESKVALFTAWRAVFGDTGATVAEALGEARRAHQRVDGDYEPLFPALRDAIRSAVGDKMESKALAGWLRRHRDQRVADMALGKVEDRHLKQFRWVVAGKAG